MPFAVIPDVIVALGHDLMAGTKSQRVDAYIERVVAVELEPNGAVVIYIA